MPQLHQLHGKIIYFVATSNKSVEPPANEEVENKQSLSFGRQIKRMPFRCCSALVRSVVQVTQTRINVHVWRPTQLSGNSSHTVGKRLRLAIQRSLCIEQTHTQQNSVGVTRPRLHIRVHTNAQAHVHTTSHTLACTSVWKPTV